MRLIDLLCKLIGPLFIALVDGISTETAIKVNFAMNLTSTVLEYLSIAKVRPRKHLPLIPRFTYGLLIADDVRYTIMYPNYRALSKRLELNHQIQGQNLMGFFHVFGRLVVSSHKIVPKISIFIFIIASFFRHLPGLCYISLSCHSRGKWSLGFCRPRTTLPRLQSREHCLSHSRSSPHALHPGLWEGSGQLELAFGWRARRLFV